MPFNIVNTSSVFKLVLRKALIWDYSTSFYKCSRSFFLWDWHVSPRKIWWILLRSSSSLNLLNAMTPPNNYTIGKYHFSRYTVPPWYCLSSSLKTKFGLSNHTIQISNTANRITNSIYLCLIFFCTDYDIPFLRNLSITNIIHIKEKVVFDMATPR